MNISKIVRRFIQFIAANLLLGSLFIMLLGAVVLVFMVVQWRRLGLWPDWSPIALGSIPPETQLLGVNKIIAGVYGLPMPVVIWLGGMIVGGVSVMLDKMVEQSKGESARRYYPRY
jgi:hypothetical protein